MLPQNYVNGTEDIPLYEGFTLKDNDDVAFDAIDGRLIDVTYESKTASIHSVRKFYHNTLPQLGWTPHLHQSYQRDGEILKITILKNRQNVELKFNISPS